MAVWDQFKFIWLCINKIKFASIKNASHSLARRKQTEKASSTAKRSKIGRIHIKTRNLEKKEKVRMPKTCYWILYRIQHRMPTGKLFIKRFNCQIKRELTMIVITLVSSSIMMLPYCKSLWQNPIDQSPDSSFSNK